MICKRYDLTDKASSKIILKDTFMTQKIDSVAIYIILLHITNFKVAMHPNC